MEIKVEDGKLSINVYDLFSNLTEEEMEDVAKTYLWHSSIYKNLVQELKENLSGPNYNDSLYQIEKAFFTMDEPSEFYDWDRDHFEDRVFYTMKQAFREILKENAELHVKLYKHDCARAKVYNMISDVYGNDVAYKVNSAYVNEEFAKPYSYELSTQLAEKINFVELTEKWVDEMMKRFNPIKSEDKI
jgi:hypothetical protein